MAVLTLEEYKKKKKQEEIQQQKNSNKKSSVMTLEEYKKQPGAKLGRTDGSDIQYLPESSQKSIRLNQARKDYEEKTRELENATSKLNAIREKNLKQAGVKSLKELLEEEKNKPLPSYSSVKQGNSISLPTRLNESISENNSKYAQVDNAPEVVKERENVNKIEDDLGLNKKLHILPAILKTGGNIATNVATGTGRALENFYDFTLNASTAVNTGLEELLGMSKESVKKERENAQNIIKRNLVNEGLEKLGWDEEMYKQWEKDSLVKRDNLGGKVAQGIGEMFPTLLAGNAVGGLPEKATKVQKLISSIPTTMTLGVSSYGGGLEQAYSEGANMSQANKYALGSALTEVATEWLTGGVPGVNDAGILDNLEEKTLSKVSNNLAKFLIKEGYNIVGEGAEEALSEIINPYLKNATYAQGEKVNWSDVIESAVVGGITGGILDLPSNVANYKTETYNQNYNKSADSNENIQNNINLPITQNISQKSIKLPTNMSQNVDINTNKNIATDNIINGNINPLKNLQQFNQNQQEINNQQIQEETNKRIANIENEMNNLLPTASTEGMTLQESAARYNIDPQKQIATQTMMENRGVEARWDGTRAEFKDGTVNAIWQKDENGNRSVIFNPNASEDAIIENIAIHELTHDIMSSQNSNEALKANEIIDYVKTIEGYEKARQSLEETYSKQYNPESKNFKSLIDEEVVADVLGRKLGNQEFINRLNNQKPKLARNIYNWVVEKINSIVNRGGKVRNERIYWENVKNRFETAFNMEYNNSTNEADTRLATVENNPYGHVKDFVEMTKKEQEEIHEVVSPLAAKFAGIEESYSVRDINGNKIIFDIFSDGNYRITEIEKTKNIIEEVVDERNPNKDSRYSMASSEQQQRYSGNGNESNRNNGTSKQDARISTKEQIESQDRLSNKTQERNNRELDNSSFSLKQKQNDIIQKYNPKDESLGEHTWINSADDIKTFKEALDYDDYESGNLTPDFTEEMVNKALGSGKVTIYSSYPIEQGTFVTPSKMEAGNYAGNNKIYSKEVSLKDVAWLDSLQGQYAKVDNNFNDIKHHYKTENNIETSTNETSTTDNQGRTLSKEQQEYFKDSKVKDEDGRLIPVYHGTTEEINIFDKNRLGKNTGAASAGEGFFFTDNKKIAEDYSRYARPQYIKDLENEYKKLEKEAQKTGNWDDYYRAYEKYEDAELTYAYNEDNQRTNAENQKEVYLNLTNPLIHDFKGMEYRDESYYDLLKQAKENGNDGAIFKNTYDGYGEKGSWDNPMTNIYVAFESNQIKNVDNTNPTKNEDIRYSKENKNWSKWIDDNFKQEGTTTKLGDIKLPTKKQPNIPTKQTPKETTKQNILPTNKELANKKVEQKVNKQGLEAIRKATNAGKSYLQLKQSEVKALRNDLKEYLGLSKEQLTNAKTYNGIKDKVEQFMNKQVEYLDEDLKRVKKEVRNTKIKVDPSVREQITDYGEFRKQNFGKLRLTSDGINVDGVYSELSELYPYYFDSSITSEADMLYELSDFMNKPNTIIEEYKLSDSDMQKATDKIFNSLINNSLSSEDIESMQNDILEKYSRRTRKVVQEEVLNDMGVTVDDISKGKDISAAEFQRTDPVRVNEKVFGAEVGQKMNDATVNRTKHNEAEGIRFLNKERDDIRELGIKPRSKESAAVQKYGEKQYLNKENELVKYGDIELANEFPNVKIQEKIKHAAEVIRNKYDKYIEQINNVITKMGYDPIPKRPDYMRHFQEINDKLSQWGIPLNPTDLNKENIPTDINGLTDQFRPGKNWFASAMQRKGFKTTYDAITGIDGYLESAKNLIYHTEDIQRYRALSKFIRDTYGQTHGMDNVDIDTEEGQQRLNDIFDNKLSKYVAWLDEQANSLAGKKGGIDRAAERLLGRKVYSVLDAAKKQVGSNMTGFNVRSALTNFASAVQGASKTNKLAFVKGTLSTLKNIVHNDGLINKSDFLTSRFGSDQLSKKLWQKASNAGQIFMTGSDYFTANQIWRSKYYENLSKKMSESQAIKNADDFAARIMGDRSKGSTAEIFNSKTLGLLTQFQLEVNNQWSSLIHDNKMDIKRGNKSGATVVFQLGQLAAMSYFFNNFMKSLTGSDVMIDPIDMFKKLLGSDDDDDDEEKTLEQRATEVFGDLINDLPFASFLTGGRIPMAEAFTGVETAFKKLTNQKDKFGNDIKWDDVKKDAISSGFYWLLPTGYGQIRKTSKGLSMYDKKLPVPGSYTESGNLRFDADTSTGGKVKAALFGQYSSKQAQDYIDSGYKTIRKQNLPEMKDLGMNASEYRKYREQLSSAGKKSIQKINYVDDSDYAEKQKNIMYKNILKLKDKELSVVNNMSIKDQNKYLTTRTQANSINSDKDIESSEKKQRISNLIIDTNLSDKDMAYLYSKYYSSEDKINMILDMNIPIKEYIKADTKEVNGSYYAKTGKTVKNSKMKEYAKYVNTLNLSAAQKAIIVKMKYNSFKTYDNKIVNYVNNINTSANEKKVMLKSIGFKNFDKDVINYINSQHISREEKEKKLKGLGFTIRDGRVYYK